MTTDPYGYNRGRDNAAQQAHIKQSRKNGDPDTIDWDYWLARMKAILNGDKP